MNFLNNYTFSGVFFISSNSWDIAGATSAGIKSIWLNRNRDVFDKYPYKPYGIAQSLGRIVEII
jgi:2-haloacid dehalogenase